ncbi:MAG: hypothetical protein AAF193_08930, partial [Bacteroidota bacterium]
MKAKLGALILFVMFLLSGGYSALGQLSEVESFFQEIEEKSKEKPQTIRFIQEEDSLVADFSKLSQIVIIRHGEPTLDHKVRRSRKETVAYVRQYDSVGVYPPHFIPFILEPDELKVIHTSNINRAISTAEQVFG